MFSTRDIQARCNALGHNAGRVDGMMGPKTRKALQDAMEAECVSRFTHLFHPSGVHRIHLHWSAGAYGVISMERRAYNGLVDQDGNRHDGVFAFNTQGTYRADRAASHTLNANSGALGLCADAMAGAKERPLDWGSAPMTVPQVKELCQWAAELAEFYDIPVSRWSILTHAEVQPTLGIRQRFKWDITCLPGDNAVRDPIVVGDELREMISERMTA
ncbi:MAG: peptidoglycan-binding protein [Pseudomonadota bacterium]